MHTHLYKPMHTHTNTEETEYIKLCIYNLGDLQFVMQPKKDNWGYLPVCK